MSTSVNLAELARTQAQNAKVADTAPGGLQLTPMLAKDLTARELVTSPTRLRGELLSGDKARMTEAARAPRLNLAAALRHMTPSERDRVILNMPASEARRYLRPAVQGIEGVELSDRARQKLGLPEP